MDDMVALLAIDNITFYCYSSIIIVIILLPSIVIVVVL